MSEILGALHGLKNKLNNIETTLSNIVDDRKPIKERIDEKYLNLIKLQNQVIRIDAGGNDNVFITYESVKNSKFTNILQKEIENYVPNTSIFIDISYRHMVPIIDILRKSAVTADDKMLTIIIDCDKEVLIDEIKKFFSGDVEKIIERCDFVYHYKVDSVRRLLEEEKKKKEMLSKIWDKKYSIKCYKCGKINDGTFNRLKYHSVRNDEYVIDGHFATCKPCDPNATYQV